MCASGGNAGLAAAYAAKLLNIPAIIVLPKSTPDFVADKLRDEVGSLIKQSQENLVSNSLTLSPYILAQRLLQISLLTLRDEIGNVIYQS